MIVGPLADVITVVDVVDVITVVAVIVTFVTGGDSKTTATAALIGILGIAILGPRIGMMATAATETMIVKKVMILVMISIWR